MDDELTGHEDAHDHRSSIIDRDSGRMEANKSPRNRRLMSASQFPESMASKAFRARIESIPELVFISPYDLDLVREISDRAVAVVTEEARLFSPDADESMGCVVKTYRPGVVASQKAMDELIEECRMIHALDHRCPSLSLPTSCQPRAQHSIERRHMIRMLGLGCFESSSKRDIRDSLFVVEEFGGTWSMYKILKSKRLHPNHPHVQFTPEDCLRWLINIAEAVAYLHENDIVHRDIKPENGTLHLQILILFSRRDPSLTLLAATIHITQLNTPVVFQSG